MRFNQFKRICSVITAFASEKEELFNENVVDEVVFNPQLIDESL